MPPIISEQEAEAHNRVRQGGSGSAEVQFCLDMGVGEITEFDPDEYQVVSVGDATLPSRLSSIAANKSYKFKTSHFKDANGRIGLEVRKVARSEDNSAD